MIHIPIPPSPASILITLCLLLMPVAGITQSHDHRHDKKPHATGTADDITTMDLRMGAMIYEMSCTACHGRKGRGDGGAAIFLGPYSHPRPNDFKTGTIKFRSTPAGEAPMLTDLMRTIREGIPGFMPAFRNLGEDRIRQVAAFVATEFMPEPLARTSAIALPDYPGPAAMTPASVKHGRRLYTDLGCTGCHGNDGKGAPVHLEDSRGLMIMPMDLTRPGMFGGGRRPEDLYRTLMTGLDGTPMPGYADSFRGREHELWDLVHYLRSLWVH